jgi:hypothetical protein
MISRSVFYNRAIKIVSGSALGARCATVAPTKWKTQQPRFKGLANIK